MREDFSLKTIREDFSIRELYRVSGNYLPIVYESSMPPCAFGTSGILPRHASDYPQTSIGHVTHPGCLNFIVESCKRSFSGTRHSDAQVVSATAKEHSLSTCYRSVAMVKAGMKQAGVTTHISVSVRSIKIWRSRDRTGESFRSRAGPGSKTALSRVAKIVLAKAALKR